MINLLGNTARKFEMTKSTLALRILAEKGLKKLSLTTVVSFQTFSMLTSTGIEV